MKKINLFALLLLTFFMFAFGATDIVRKVGFLRNIFYPDTYERKGLGDDTDGEKFDHASYDKVLKNAVNSSGYVDYTAIAANPENLDLYIEQLKQSDTNKLSRYEHLALMINAYNALTLKLITEYPGIDSIRDIPSSKSWDDKRWKVGEATLSLNGIEHEVIRNIYGESRIHFALVCASVGCPKLRNEAFTGDTLVAQLNDQTSHFFAQDQNFRWDSDKNTVYLSSLLDWFRGDFADDERGALEYTFQYIDKATAEQIKANIDNIKIKYINYDWSINGKWK